MLQLMEVAEIAELSFNLFIRLNRRISAFSQATTTNSRIYRWSLLLAPDRRLCDCTRFNDYFLVVHVEQSVYLCPDSDFKWMTFDLGIWHAGSIW